MHPLLFNCGEVVKLVQMRVLIIGCGYAGLRLGAELKKLGHMVFGLRRSVPSADGLAQGMEWLRADISKPEDLAAVPNNFDWIVNTVSSSHGGAAEYRNAYLTGTRNVLNWLSGAGVKKYVYTSSTSVYGQTGGEIVKETSAAEPASETAKILLETEGLLLAAAREKQCPAVILRVAGIYGPDRGFLLQQYLKNEARIIGKGERHLNMIHVDDLAGVIIAALRAGRPGEIYNVTDDEPVAEIHFFRWLSETLGKWMPPFAPEEGVRKRALTDKRIQNRKLKMELGCQLKYPTFRQGYTAEIQRLERAGKLDIEPEPR